MLNLFKRKSDRQSLEWDPDRWDEIGPIAEPRADHYAHRYPDGTEPATVEEHTAWLMGYVAQGGKIAHRRSEWKYHERRYRIAYKDTVVARELGARAYVLIVRAGLKWSAPNGIGHITVCEMDGFKITDPGMVEEFSDAIVTPRTAADWRRYY